MIKLNKYEQQIILACKGWSDWSEKEGRFKAVKVVISQYYALDIDDMGVYTMYHCLLELFLKITKDRILMIQDFLENIFKCEWSGGYKNEIDMEHIVRNLISRISNTMVKDNNGNDLFEELEPDYEILNKGINSIDINNQSC